MDVEVVAESMVVEAEHMVVAKRVAWTEKEVVTKVEEETMEVVEGKVVKVGVQEVEKEVVVKVGVQEVEKGVVVKEAGKLVEKVEVNEAVETVAVEVMMEVEVQSMHSI